MKHRFRIIAFACHWCAYAAADLAGTARMAYPASVRIIRVLCSSMVHPHLVLEAFQRGADGVLVMGCREGECHYLDGNLRAKDRLSALEDMLETMGIESERFRLVWCSSAEAERFTQACVEMEQTLASLG
ncbi:F420-non-reducing hydrogenase iron-sulfur subunit [Desulfacinum hydrothermale DSM 13146]|uniref:F420-non-reducing hydrogenase iron-sulfur subunit n=1 Tax=Desulfacinum hydrothermale DSM 13146 TaxID=1121390 RepID=A0A1W1XJD1_9BACT|nr:hydrogenase iron-sulfur subunit [Desulfacinum hydrothermale]SMC23922.1 F420-non-reducing hydrogenase iron-sulfur subunit [Desulfacinum hydrothermale DSM 13146]